MKKLIIFIYLFLFLGGAYQVSADTSIATPWLYGADCSVINTEKTSNTDDIYYCVGWNYDNYAHNVPAIKIYSYTWWLIYSHIGSDTSWSWIHPSISISHVSVTWPDDNIYILVKATGGYEYHPYWTSVWTFLLRGNSEWFSMLHNEDFRYIDNNPGNLSELSYDNNNLYLRYNNSSYGYWYYSYNVVTGTPGTSQPPWDGRTNSIPIAWQWFMNTWNYDSDLEDYVFLGYYLDTSKLHNYYYVTSTHYNNDYFSFSTSGYFDSTPGTIRGVVKSQDSTWDLQVNQANACYTSYLGWWLKWYYYCLGENVYAYNTDSVQQSVYWPLNITYNNIDTTLYSYYWGTDGHLYSSMTIAEVIPDDIITEFNPWIAVETDSYVYWPYMSSNLDYSLSADIYKYVNSEPVLDWTVELWSFSGVLSSTWVWEAPTIYQSDYGFNLFNDYIVRFNYVNLTNESDSWSIEYNLYYDPAWIEVNITEESFTFSVDKVNKLDNWFSIDWFQVYPNCGNVTFDIIGPNAAGTWTIEIPAWPFFCNAQDPVNWYGSGKTVTVTYPYHQYPWQYSFVMKYTWWEYTIYPFWTGAINYFITAPRQLGDTWYTEDWVAYDDSIWDFDKNGDWEITISEFFSWLAAIPGYYLRKIYSYFWELIKIVKKFSWFATMEETNWTSFIYSTTYAEGESLGWVWERDLDTVGYNDTVLWHISTFLMGFIYFILFVIGVVVFIHLAKKK